MYQGVRLCDASRKYDDPSRVPLSGVFDRAAGEETEGESREAPSRVPLSGVFGRATGGETEVESHEPPCLAVFGRAVGEETEDDAPIAEGGFI